MKTTTSLSLLVLGAVAAAAQTTAKAPVKHTPATTAHTTATAPVKPAGGCVVVPTISSKIPALAATAGCPKALYTISQKPAITADYLSPMLSPEVRAELDFQPSTFTLAYVDTTVGTGELVKQGQYVTVKYTGWTVDGSKFDSSDDHPGKEPLTLGYGQHKVIQGWDTGFEGMHIGGKRRLFIPYQLAYGEQGRPPVIPAKAMLIFDVEIVGQSATPPAPPAPPTPATPPPTAKPADTPKPATTTEPKN